MAKINFTKMPSWCANLLGIVLSAIVAFLFSIPWGIGYAIDWVTDLILYSIIIEVAIDLVEKLRKNEEEPKLCWEYFVGIVLVLLADWAFMAAAHTVETIPFFQWIACTVAIAVGASIWFSKAVAKGYKRLATKSNEN